MNKGITIIILAVVLSAMALIFYSHTRRPSGDPASSSGNATESASRPGANGTYGSGAADPVRGNPLQSPQGGNGGIAHIDPPLSTPGHEGAPTPVIVTTGNSGEPVRVVTSPTDPALGGQPDAGKNPLVVTTPTEPTPVEPPKRGPTGAPSLTPLSLGQPETPPAKAPEIKQPPKPPVKDPAKDNGKEPAKPEDKKDDKKDNGKDKAPVLSDKGTHTLKNIGMRFAGQKIELHIESDSAFPCKSFMLTNPNRLVIDLPGTWKGMKAPAVPQNRLIKGVRLGNQATGPRLVLDLSEAPKGHDIVRSGNTVEVVVY